ncbi:hypothetical protein GQ42DRAFT_153044 [Ramicandelaber brevisporus]|nr:hypothetical protein GQ42DRAFT_153044 [Ramicandelaber brevisporus]
MKLSAILLFSLVLVGSVLSKCNKSNVVDMVYRSHYGDGRLDPSIVDCGVIEQCTRVEVSRILNDLKDDGLDKGLERICSKVLKQSATSRKATNAQGPPANLRLNLRMNILRKAARG